MLAPPNSFPSDGQPQFERHIKTRGGRALLVQFNPGKVMDRVLASLYESENTVQTPAPAWNFKDRPRRKPKCGDSANIGETQTLKLFVVGNIQKYFIGRPSRT